MDLNERLAARRKELAMEEERLRIATQQQRQAEIEAARQAAQAAAEAMPATPDLMKLQTPAQKSVDMEEGIQLFKDAVERTTKKQVAIFCAMGLLALIGLAKDPLMAIFWSVFALGYLGMTINDHANAIRNLADKPEVH
ncbi:hypothetical protein ACIGHN_11935 [Acidovorax sp. NPDC077693]|uniref:hypothetical protein n=1 Tax=unclassified Acidovorax TaxID=2684926 RepID=UPI0037C93A2F